MNNVFQDSGVPTAFQFMPPGVSIITAHVNGKAGTREVHVDASTAERLQRDLEEKLAAAAAGQKARPCGLFDHKDGKASLLPKRFYWKDGEGVMLECDWTAAGKAAVSGRDYSYWSPCFRLNNGEVVGLASGVEVGSLVNNPAFETIARIAASRPRVDAPEDEGEVEVNGGAVEVDAAHCNQYQHVPGCKNGGGGSGGGKEDASGGSVEKLKKDIERLEQDFRSKRGEYAQMVNDEAYGYLPWDDDERAQFKENKRKAEAASYEAGEKLRKAKKRLADEYRKLGETAKADWLEHEATGRKPWLERNDNVKSSKPEDTEPEEKKELSPLKRAQLAALEKEKKRRARKDAKDAGMQDALERVRLAAAGCKCKPGMERVKECVKAANPYGCNQFGHGFKVEHKGYGAGGQKTLKLEGTDKAHQEARKILQERIEKRREQERKREERERAEREKYGNESKREKYERMARERDEKHAAAVKKAEDELRDIDSEQRATFRRGENDEWTDELHRKMKELSKKEEAAAKRLEDAKRKQADWERKKQKHWKYDQEYGTTTLFR